MIQIDMLMPDNCLECRFNISEFGYCNAMPVEFVGQVSDCEEDGRPEWCPLKAQEPVEPTKPDEDNVVYCGACGAPVGYEVLEPPGMDYIRYNYCQNCGRKVRWE